MNKCIIPTHKLICILKSKNNTSLEKWHNLLNQYHIEGNNIMSHLGEKYIPQTYCINKYGINKDLKEILDSMDLSFHLLLPRKKTDNPCIYFSTVTCISDFENKQLLLALSKIKKYVNMFGVTYILSNSSEYVIEMNNIK